MCHQLKMETALARSRLLTSFRSSTPVTPNDHVDIEITYNEKQNETSVKVLSFVQTAQGAENTGVSPDVVAFVRSLKHQFTVKGRATRSFSTEQDDDRFLDEYFWEKLSKATEFERFITSTLSRPFNQKVKRHVTITKRS